MTRSVSIAIIQATAPYDDVEGGVKLACNYIKQTCASGAQLVIFGECWLSGYPAWIDHASDYAKWDHTKTKEVFRTVYANSVVIDGPEIAAICACAKDHHAVVCLGFNEKTAIPTGTLFNSFVIINSDGAILQHHRKLMPTHTERLIHGLGDGRGLGAVETSIGRIGALICWEHWMPLVRQAMHDTREEIHIALWPSAHEMLQIASRHYAFEGRCFVVAAGQLMRFDQLPGFNYDHARLEGEQALNGGTSVIGPDGHYLVEPQFDSPDIVYTEIPDLDVSIGEKMALDVSGHYQRPDLFRFEII